MDPLTLSRFQFGDTAAFHIIWPLMSIGLSLFMFVMEALWLYTGKEVYYRQIRFWMKIFVLTFAIGVASGFPLSFQFGTNWAAFATAAGSFFGNILGFETTIAFTLETASLGIMIFGWQRVSRTVHFLADFGVLFGASLSGFWIVVANSWMQIPRGVVFEGGKFVVTNYMEAIFNPGAIVSFVHMWFACIEATLFMMGGIAALALLRSAHSEEARLFFTRTLTYAIGLAIVITPLQVVVGDTLGLVVAKYQPEKLAAVELHWDTNAEGVGAPWSLVALPNAEGTGNRLDIQIPNVLSILTTHTLAGQVQGLNDFPVEDRPTLLDDVLIFYSFRIMVGIGFFLMFLTALSVWYWYKKRLTPHGLTNLRWFLWLWVVSIPMGFIATEAGWMVREIGRQPWIVYHQMRVSDALSSHLESAVVGGTIIGITLIYSVLAFLFVYFTYRIVKKGPDLTSPLP